MRIARWRSWDLPGCDLKPGRAFAVWAPSSDAIGGADAPVDHPRKGRLEVCLPSELATEVVYPELLASPEWFGQLQRRARSRSAPWGSGPSLTFRAARDARARRGIESSWPPSDFASRHAIGGTSGPHLRRATRRRWICLDETSLVSRNGEISEEGAWAGGGYPCGRWVGRARATYYHDLAKAQAGHG